MSCLRLLHAVHHLLHLLTALIGCGPLLLRDIKWYLRCSIWGIALKWWLVMIWYWRLRRLLLVLHVVFLW